MIISSQELDTNADSNPYKHDAPQAPPDNPFGVYRITAPPASGHKCARCWNFMPEVANYGIWQNVCTRCHDALVEMNINPPQPQEAVK
jgi:hypothetical protein